MASLKKSNNHFRENKIREDNLIKRYACKYFLQEIDEALPLYFIDDLDFLFIEEWGYGCASCYDYLSTGHDYEKKSEPFNTSREFFGWESLDTSYGTDFCLVSIGKDSITDFIRQELNHELNNDLKPFFDWCEDNGYTNDSSIDWYSIELE